MPVPQDRHPRIKPGVEALLVHGDGRSAPVKLRDLSVTGCCLEAVSGPPEGPFAVELPLTPAIRAPARIARIEPRPDGTVNLALAFQDLAWTEICALARYLAPSL